VLLGSKRVLAEQVLAGGANGLRRTAGANPFQTRVGAHADQRDGGRAHHAARRPGGMQRARRRHVTKLLNLD
jgi:hypothetical protein